MGSENLRHCPNSRPLELERLEERIAPAGGITVFVSAGNLTVTGDEEANSFAVDDAGLGACELRITPAPGTAINGGSSPMVFTGVTGRMKMNLAGGDDAVTFGGISVAKDVVIDAGAGTNHVTFLQCTIGGSLSIKTTAASSVDSLTATGLNVARGITISHTEGGQHVALTDGQAGGDVSITTRGQDYDSDLALDNFDVGGRLKVTYGRTWGSGLSVTNSQVGGIHARCGAGDYVFSFSGSQTVKGKGGINLSYGSGDVAAYISNSTVYDSVSFKTSAGWMPPSLGWATAFALTDSTVLGKLTVSNCYSEDAVSLSGSAVAKGLNINNGSGPSAVTISDSVIGVDPVTGKTSAATISSIDDAAINFNSVTVGGNLSVKTQSGHDTVAFSKLNLDGTVAIKTGGGNDAISLEDNDFGGALSIDTGAGDDSVVMDSGDELFDPWSTYGGPVKISLGSGNDFLQMGCPVPMTSFGVYQKAVALNGGSDTDELFYVDNRNSFTVDPKIAQFENTH